MKEIRKSTEYVSMPDGERIALHSWLPEGQISKIVQVSHGMVEYARRYDHFGDFLCRNGIGMYAHDHRGHGETALTADRLGFLSEKDGFQTVVEDLREIIKHVKRKHPVCKIILFGHSFGSFISQSYIEQYGSEIDACILSGTAGPRPLLVCAAKCMAFIIKTLKGAVYRSQFMNKLAFGSYNRRVPNPKSKNAWLTRDEAIVEEYDSNIYTTFTPTIGFFYDLFSGLCRIHAKREIDAIPKDMPLFLFAGEEDPVGDYGKTVGELYRLYRSVGICDVSFKLYPNGRHEMLNELNRQEVMADILEWIESR